MKQMQPNTPQENPQENPKMPLARKNYAVLLIGLGVILLGMLLMAGGKSTSTEEFNYAMFSFRRITLAPILVVGGFAIEIFGSLWRPKQ